MKKLFLLSTAAVGMGLFGTVLTPLSASDVSPAAEPFQEDIFHDPLNVPEKVTIPGESLSLEEASKLALMNGLDIQIAEQEIRIQNLEQAAAESIYDTKFAADATYLHDQSQRASIILGNRQIEGAVTTSLEKMLPTGTVLKAEAGTERTSTNTAFTTFNRYYTGFLEFTVKQPLLDNFFGYVDRKKIQRVQFDITRYRYQKLDEIEKSIFETRKAYWELVFAYGSLAKRQEALKRAQDFWEITKEHFKLGTSETPDVYAAEANVRTKVIDVWEAATLLQAKSFELRVMLNRPEITLILPNDKPSYAPVEVEKETATETALNFRFDLKQKNAELESERIRLKIAKTEMLPELDFEGRYASTSLDRQMASSQGEVFGYNHPRFFAGFSFSTPLERRSETSERDQAKLGVEKLEKEVRLLKMTILKEMDGSLRALELSEKRAFQMRHIEELQKKKLEEEQKNFNLGRSSSKTMIDYQNDVIHAEIEALRAAVDYAVAQDSLFRTENTLLEKINTQPDSPASPSEQEPHA